MKTALVCAKLLHLYEIQLLSRISQTELMLDQPPAARLHWLPSRLGIVSPANAVLMHDSPKPSRPIFSLSDCQQMGSEAALGVSFQPWHTGVLRRWLQMYLFAVCNEQSTGLKCSSAAGWTGIRGWLLHKVTDLEEAFLLSCMLIVGCVYLCTHRKTACPVQAPCEQICRFLHIHFKAIRHEDNLAFIAWPLPRGRENPSGDLRATS